MNTQIYRETQFALLIGAHKADGRLSLGLHVAK